jgi:hypothetical protein
MTKEKSPMRNNTPSIKPLLWILAILLIMVFWPHQASKNPAGPAQGVNTPSLNNPSFTPTDNVSGDDQRNIIKNTILKPGQTGSVNAESPNSAAVANPIPTDDEALARVAEQNQQHDQLYAILHEHAELAAQVRQAAKYQTDVPETAPAPNTALPSADVMQKLQSNQVVHH